MMAAAVASGRLIDRLPAVRGRLSGNAPLAPVTWFRVGGAAPMQWRLRWSAPEELDAWAAEHGMRLAARWSTWSRTPFDPSCERHVSTWVLDES